MDTQQQNPNQPIKSSKKPLKYGLSIAVILICLIATAVALYWIWTEPVDHVVVNICTNCKKTPYQTAGWQIYRNEEHGFEFKYPEKFEGKVWSSLIWPPKVSVTSGDEADAVKKGCSTYPISTLDVIREENEINGIDFKLIKAGEGALGSYLTNYCYLTQKGGKYYILNFATSNINGCGGGRCDGAICGFGDPKEEDCKNFDGKKEIEKPIEKILSTFEFFEPVKPQSFENQYLKIASIPVGWKIEQAGNSVNISKDNYILFINPRTSQASGIIGGRFSEIAQGAPGVELVLKSHPANSCGDREMTRISDDFTRFDFFVSKTNAGLDNCNAPSGERNVWYFSYVTNNGTSYFGDLAATDAYFGDNQQKQFVITMTYEADNINALPEKQVAKNSQMLEDMSDILRGVSFK